MKRCLCFCLLLFLVLPAFAEKLNLMVFGDSLSAGYKLNYKEAFGAQLEAALTKKGYQVQIINYSASGITTADGVRRLRTALFKKPDAVILELGANDMLQNVDLEKTRANLQTLITSFKQNQIPILLVGMEASSKQSEEYRRNFRQLYADLALENELLLYPFFMKGLWKEDGSHLNDSYFLPDQVHPSAKGVTVIVKHILPVVEQFIAEDVADVTVKKGE